MQSYTFEKKIRATLYGDIYRATDSHGHPYAVKVSDMSSARLVQSGENPKGEVEIMDKISSLSGAHLEETGHRFVLKLMDRFHFEDEGHTYLCTVMEVAEQDLLEKLQSLLARKKQMSFRVARVMFEQLVQGVGFLHNNGISHLDLSLENVLLVNGEVRICDFGQAEVRRFFKACGQRKGKVRYMCPEVLERQAYDGFKADVWSLGVILWTMLTGSLPYKVPNATDECFQYLMKGRVGIESLLGALCVEDIPPAVMDLLAGMLSVDAEKRWTIEGILSHPWVRAQLLVVTPSNSKLEDSSLSTLSLSAPSTPSAPSSVIVRTLVSSSFVKTRALTSQQSDDLEPIIRYLSDGVLVYSAARKVRKAASESQLTSLFPLQSQNSVRKYG